VAGPTQLPIEHWHAWLGHPTIADAILDRLLSREHRIHLRGESLRRQRRSANPKPEASITSN